MMEYLRPDFSNCKTFHDWKNYIGENTRKLWSTFNDAQKSALFLDAHEQALNEVYDHDFE